MLSGLVMVACAGIGVTEGSEALLDFDRELVRVFHALSRLLDVFRSGVGVGAFCASFPDDGDMRPDDAELAELGGYGDAPR
jgi:hypothetical protein